MRRLVSRCEALVSRWWRLFISPSSDVVGSAQTAWSQLLGRGPRLSTRGQRHLVRPPMAAASSSAWMAAAPSAAFETRFAVTAGHGGPSLEAFETLVKQAHGPCAIRPGRRHRRARRAARCRVSTGLGHALRQHALAARQVHAHRVPADLERVYQKLSTSTPGRSR